MELDFGTLRTYVKCNKNKTPGNEKFKTASHKNDSCSYAPIK
jgi:hypothetical protein